MPTTTTNVGRQSLVHPDLGYDGGAGQHTLLRNIVAHQSNQTNIFWNGTITVANTGTTAVTHNLNMPLANLKVFIVESNATLDQATQTARYTITQTSVNVIQVQNVSGGSRTFDVYVAVKSFIQGTELDPAVAISTTGNITGANVAATGTMTASADPVTALQVATKQYADSLFQGVKWKEDVRAATTANISLSAPQTIDGVSVIAGNRVLVKDQTTGSQNGIYVVAAGAWTRAVDADTSSEILGCQVSVQEGTVNADRSYRLITDTITLGTTSLVFSLVFGQGTYTADGQGLELSGNVFSLELDGTSLAKSAAGVKVNVAGAPVGTTDTQNLTNKTISSTSALTGAFTLPVGSTAQRPSGVSGYSRFNSDTNEFEGFANGAWSSIGGGLNELALKNYLKTYANAAVVPGTLSTLASTTANLASLTAFYADATSGAAALTSSSDTTLRGSFNYLTAVSGSNSTGTRFVQFPAFALEGSDLGKPVSIAFDVNGVTADGNWDLVVVRYNSSGVHQSIISVAGNASGATPASAKLPTGTTQFNGFFVPDSTTAGDLYALRFRSLANTVNIRVDTLFVGPQPVRTGSAMTDWVAYTPSLSAGISATTNFGFYRRVGTNLEILIRYQQNTGANGTGSTEVAFGLPTEFQGKIDTNQVPLNNPRVQIGSAQVATLGTTYSAQQTVVAGASGNVVAILKSGSGAFWVGSDIPNTSIISIAATLPIIGFSTNQIQGDRAVEEYAFNTDISSTVSVTASGFANGPQGQTLSGSAFAYGSNYIRRVRFNTPILVTDRITIEIGNDTGWAPIDLRLGSTFSLNGVTYGAFTSIVNSTDVDVGFGGGGYGNPTSFGGNGAAWGVNVRWRLRKVSGGAQVGYPLSVANFTDAANGIYTPTISALSNLSTVTLRNAMYSRMGSIVTVTAAFNATAASAGLLAEFRINLPVVSNLANGDQLLGAGTIYDSTATGSVLVSGDSSTDVAVINFRTVTGTSDLCTVVFSYQVF